MKIKIGIALLVSVLLFGCGSSSSDALVEEPVVDTPVATDPPPESKTYEELKALADAPTPNPGQGKFFGIIDFESGAFRIEGSSSENGLSHEEVEKLYDLRQITNLLEKEINKALSSENGINFISDRSIPGIFSISDSGLDSYDSRDGAIHFKFPGINHEYTLEDGTTIDGFEVSLGIDAEGKLVEFHAMVRVFSDDSLALFVDTYVPSGQVKKDYFIVHQKEMVKEPLSVDNVKALDGQDLPDDLLEKLTTGDMLGLRPHYEDKCQVDPSSENNATMVVNSKTSIGYESFYDLKNSFKKYEYGLLDANYKFEEHTGSENDIIAAIQSLGATKNSIVIELLQHGKIEIGCNSDDVRDNY